MSAFRHLQAVAASESPRNVSWLPNAEVGLGPTSQHAARPTIDADANPTT